MEATGKALDAVNAKDARDFFAHCGYRMRAEPAGLGETLTAGRTVFDPRAASPVHDPRWEELRTR